MNILILQHFSFLLVNTLLPVQYRRIAVLFLLVLISCYVKNKTLLPSCSTHSSRTNTPVQLSHTYSDQLHACILKFLPNRLFILLICNFLFLLKKCNSFPYCVSYNHTISYQPCFVSPQFLAWTFLEHNKNNNLGKLEWNKNEYSKNGLPLTRQDLQ